MRRKILMIMGVMTAHSAAEGIGVGVAFGGGRPLGDLITLAIALHNVPEGLAIALVMVPRGTTVAKAAGGRHVIPAATAAGGPGFPVRAVFRTVLPVGLGLAAGAMLWMIFSELLPEAQEEADSSTIGGDRHAGLRRDDGRDAGAWSGWRQFPPSSPRSPRRFPRPGALPPRAAACLPAPRPLRLSRRAHPEAFLRPLRARCCLQPRGLFAGHFFQPFLLLAKSLAASASMSSRKRGASHGPVTMSGTRSALPSHRAAPTGTMR